MNFVLNNFFPPESSAVYDIIRKIIVQPDRSRTKIWRRMRIQSWKPKATSTHPEYVIRFVFPTQKWFLRRRRNIKITAQCLTCLIIADLTYSFY